MSDVVRKPTEMRPKVAESAPITQTHPAIIFETTMYALTRPGENGKTQFATIDGTWTQDIAQAHMRHQPAHVDYMLPKNMNRDGAVKSFVKMSVYRCEEFDSSATPRWAATDTIVIARRTNSFGQLIERQDPMFVTHSGSIGRDNEITHRVAEAVVIKAVDNWASVKKQITAQTQMPTDKDGMWLRPRFYTMDLGKRVFQIGPVVAG